MLIAAFRLPPQPKIIPSMNFFGCFSGPSSSEVVCEGGVCRLSDRGKTRPKTISKDKGKLQSLRISLISLSARKGSKNGESRAFEDVGMGGPSL